MAEPTIRRIETLDGFRCLAVMMVIAFHYYGHIPTGSLGDNSDIDPSYAFLMYGFYGVQLFFVISGFIISHTLLKCVTFGEFMKRRLIRLLPALVVCCMITYVVMLCCRLPFQQLPTLPNFLPSLTFTFPFVWRSALSLPDVDYIDPAYWTLTVEMMFYVIGGLIFFYNRKHFRSNWLLFTTILVFARVLTSPKMHGILPGVFHPFMDTVYEWYLLLNLSTWVYFSLGIFYYSLFTEGLAGISLVDKMLMTFLIITEYYFLDGTVLRILFTAINILFLIFIYRDAWLSFLRNRFFLWIGLISYPIYLLHQNIGIMLMHRISAALKMEHLNIYLPLFVTAVMITAAYLVFRLIETPASRFLREKLLKRLS